MQTPCMWGCASLYSSRLQDSPRCRLPDSSLRQKRHKTQTQQQSPSLGIRNSQKEADGEFLDAKAHSRETSACCPMSFNTEQCAHSAGLPRTRAKPVCNFAAHSILIRDLPFILSDASWPARGFTTLKARDLGFSETACPLNYILLVAVCPFAFNEGRSSQYNSKGQ